MNSGLPSTGHSHHGCIPEATDSKILTCANQNDCLQPLKPSYCFLIITLATSSCQYTPPLWSPSLNVISILTCGCKSLKEKAECTNAQNPPVHLAVSHMYTLAASVREWTQTCSPTVPCSSGPEAIEWQWSAAWPGDCPTHNHPNRRMLFPSNTLVASPQCWCISCTVPRFNCKRCILGLPSAFLLPFHLHALFLWFCHHSLLPICTSSSPASSLSSQDSFVSQLPPNAFSSFCLEIKIYYRTSSTFLTSWFSFPSRLLEIAQTRKDS